MLKKFPLPDFVSEVASSLGIRWGIDCYSLPNKMVKNTLLVRTFSRENERRHEIGISEEVVKENIFDCAPRWMYSLCRFLLVERLGAVFGDTTQRTDPSVLIVWVSDPWVFDLMKLKLGDPAGNILSAVAKNLLDRYEEIKPMANTLAALDVMRWIAMRDRINEWPSFFVSLSTSAIFENGAWGREDNERNAQACVFYDFILRLDQLPTDPISARRRFNDASRVLFSILDCSHIPSLDVESGKWKFSRVRT